MPVKLGELLLTENLISPQQLQEALNHQKKSGGKLGKALVSLGFVKDEQIVTLLSRQYGIPSINLDHFEVDAAIIKIIPRDTARKYQMLPLSRSKATLTVAVADPTNVFAMDDVKFMTGYNVEPVVASESALEDAIEKYYGSTRPLELRTPPAPSVGSGGEPPTLGLDDLGAVGKLSEIDLDSIAQGEVDVPTRSEEHEIDLGNLAKDSDAAPVVKLADVLLVDALKRGASDIHVEPYEKEFRVRFRIDGVLYNVMALPIKLRDRLVQHLKLMARLNTLQKGLAQEGRIRLRLIAAGRGRKFEFRVSVQPTQWGENVVLRVLDRSKLILDVNRLGLEPHSAERFREGLASRRGLVLVTGPQRSGKTTTLYATIAALNRPDANITTVEDPVEFVLPGVNQVSVKRAAGESAAGVLRTLRHCDADVVLVSEIDDLETANVALELAERGRLVLSAVAAEDVTSAVVRLLGMRVDPYLLATTTSVIVGQRLVRRICRECRTEVTGEVPRRALVELGFPPEGAGAIRVWKGKGCAACSRTGYAGRVGLYEVMAISGGIGELIAAHASPVAIFRKALEEGMITLRMSGLEKIRAGLTTIDEVRRETVPGRVGGTAVPSRASGPPKSGRVHSGAEAGGDGASSSPSGRRSKDRRSGRDRRRGRPVWEIPAAASGSGARTMAKGEAEALVAQLAEANAEIARLQQRLLELNCSNITVVQLANAQAEIQALRDRLFECHAYRTAYHCLLSVRQFPREGNA